MCSVKGSLDTASAAPARPSSRAPACSPAASGQAGMFAGVCSLCSAADLGDLLLRRFIAGIDLGGAQKLHQRALLVAGLQQLAPFLHVQRSAGNLHPVVSLPCKLRSLGDQRIGFLVVVEGGVEVLARFGSLSLLVPGLRRLSMQRGRSRRRTRPRAARSAIRKINLDAAVRQRGGSSNSQASCRARSSAPSRCGLPCRPGRNFYVRNYPSNVASF